MKKVFLIFCLGLSLPASLGRADALLDAANQKYQDGRYAEAAGMFQDLIQSRGYSAALCFNLGNAELKAGRLGPALLDLERARYLAPGDAAINQNLQAARRAAGLEPDPYRWWQIVIRSIDWTVWLVVILASLTLIIVALVGLALTKTRAVESRGLRRVFRAFLFVCIPLALFFGFVELISIGFGDRIEGVVVAKEGVLRLSPFAGAEKTGSIPEGELVTVENRHDDYLWIDDRSRQSGWMQEKDLEPIVPGSFSPQK
jgi:hypothetical protein